MAPSESTVGARQLIRGEAPARRPVPHRGRSYSEQRVSPGAARSWHAQVEATFHPVLEQRRWVLWQQRPNRKDPAKRDKVPVVATGRRTGASSTDASDLADVGVRAALSRRTGHCRPGIMLGKLEDDRWLVGVDLDLALSPITGAGRAMGASRGRAVRDLRRGQPERCRHQALRLRPRAPRQSADRGRQAAGPTTRASKARRRTHRFRRAPRRRAQDARAGPLRRAALLHRHGPQARRCPRPARRHHRCLRRPGRMVANSWSATRRCQACARAPSAHLPWCNRRRAAGHRIQPARVRTGAGRGVGLRRQAHQRQGPVGQRPRLQPDGLAREPWP